MNLDELRIIGRKIRKGDSTMSMNKLVVPLMLFLFLFNTPTFAVETIGTFKMIDDKNRTIISKEVSFQEGETLYDVTKRAFDVEESKGNIITINGIHSIPNKNIHWAVFVNGKFIDLSLNEISLYANDHVVWALRNWDNQEILK
jgi:Domain of unknown function (DUF4430)